MCVSVYVCVHMQKKEGKPDEERHWSRKRDRFRLRAALKSVYSFELSPGRPAVFLPITSTSLLRERPYIIQLRKPQSTGTDRPFNKHFNLP